MEKMESTSLDLEKLNIEKIKELFPNCVTEGKIDFDVLRELLGDEIDDNKEKYQFTWNGKAKAIKLAQTPSTSTLRPCKEKSKDWETTENLYIEGDNLEVLKQLQKTYFGKIKMIYIDPPYNTGGDFVYKDNFKDSIGNYIEQTSQETTSNPETSGRYHTDWLNMMYPRLVLARNLLSEDGVIFISIDDNEVENLKKICDEIFGEQNYSAQFLWTKTSTPPSLSHKCRKTVEHILCYEKHINNQRYFGSLLSGGDVPLLNTGNPIKELLFPVGSMKFSFKNNGIMKSGQYEKVCLLDDIEINNGCNVNAFRMRGEFKWTQETLNSEIENGTYFIAKSEKLSVRFQRPYDESGYKTPNNFLNLELGKEFDIGTNESAVKELDVLKLSSVFSFPKPISLIKYLINMLCKFDKNAIVVDFFSGSATTAHAVMELNSEDNGSRKYILAQLPELLNGNEFDNICSIGEERIRRAGEQIKKEWEIKNKGEGLLTSDVEFPYDIGFKVFKLDSTNIKPWDNSKVLIEDQLSLDYNEVFKEDRTKEDILYEIMLKYGIFDMNATQVDINGKSMFRVGSRYMIVCLEDNITVEDIKAICEEKPRVVVFKEDGFANDNDKINAVYNLEKAGVEDVRCI